MQSAVILTDQVALVQNSLPIGEDFIGDLSTDKDKKICTSRSLGHAYKDTGNFLRIGTYTGQELHSLVFFRNLGQLLGVDSDGLGAVARLENADEPVSQLEHVGA